MPADTHGISIRAIAPVDRGLMSMRELGSRERLLDVSYDFYVPDGAKLETFLSTSRPPEVSAVLGGFQYQSGYAVIERTAGHYTFAAFGSMGEGCSIGIDGSPIVASDGWGRLRIQRAGLAAAFAEVTFPGDEPRHCMLAGNSNVTFGGLTFAIGGTPSASGSAALIDDLRVRTAPSRWCQGRLLSGDPVPAMGAIGPHVDATRNARTLGLASGPPATAGTRRCALIQRSSGIAAWRDSDHAWSETVPNLPVDARSGSVIWDSERRLYRAAFLTAAVPVTILFLESEDCADWSGPVAWRADATLAGELGDLAEDVETMSYLIREPSTDARARHEIYFGVDAGLSTGRLFYRASSEDGNGFAWDEDNPVARTALVDAELMSAGPRDLLFVGTTESPGRVPLLYWEVPPAIEMSNDGAHISLSNPGEFAEGLALGPNALFPSSIDSDEIVAFRMSIDGDHWRGIYESRRAGTARLAEACVSKAAEDRPPIACPTFAPSAELAVGDARCYDETCVTAPIDCGECSGTPLFVEDMGDADQWSSTAGTGMAVVEGAHLLVASSGPGELQTAELVRAVPAEGPLDILLDFRLDRWSAGCHLRIRGGGAVLDVRRDGTRGSVSSINGGEAPVDEGVWYRASISLEDRAWLYTVTDSYGFAILGAPISESAGTRGGTISIELAAAEESCRVLMTNLIALAPPT